jgi:hypothetical protein
VARCTGAIFFIFLFFSNELPNQNLAIKFIKTFDIFKGLLKIYLGLMNIVLKSKYKNNMDLGD